ncbi:bifunctional DNA-formamidopyrimidine glycosylase/DNA-(apurinic or apyrimidinic site) lyase [Caldimonas thermodepolymerans]|uniref:Formamidopyrimidine-DNA glycosylase n=1 Tax=Caldimonas thermodepolymerans TaxID=215580 RepID=A0A2S5T3P2_9BURK|nr:bifunctional DNA-formamidopyrimidine glycosylase/DNA-(apurinic or apyrimidinic site) lyase [Caldimonas thermodepolymerans]PPE69518.1 formamidopyrimidine-DNA glycosylase [Caldimonas thermodepolymerans]QPC30966.1 bifunctional DNA-formamidopyrimidine glycosylase/DNA-(apurinic or apyrimidinic site) lyase [Caldimonas thermodepolymerans]RDH97019.1 DNA-(apurinic or apyrimidinic site) lyase [Caldimonas thermodepolymerans]
MPELPEVEVTRLSFADRIQGARIEAVRLGKPLRWPLGCAPERLVGQAVGTVSRRGKYLWMALDEGGLLLHLGMSGSLRFAPLAPPPGPHDHFDLATDRGLLRLHDPRRFGAVVWAPALDAPPAVKLLGTLGIEPFDPAFDGAYLHQRLRGRRVSIKQALLAGDIVVGVGNIYASEALFGAGIDPRTAAGRIGLARCERLAASIRTTLRRALEVGGSTLRDFRNAEGQSGYFQLETQVYDREGLPCRRCGTPVRRIQQGQRSTFFCPQCQRR